MQSLTCIEFVIKRKCIISKSKFQRKIFEESLGPEEVHGKKSVKTALLWVTDTLNMIIKMAKNGERVGSKCNSLLGVCFIFFYRKHSNIPV